MKVVDYIRKRIEDKREEKAELDFMKLQSFEEGESNKQKAIATNMLKDKVDVKSISKYTGLSTAEIKELKTEVTC